MNPLITPGVDPRRSRIPSGETPIYLPTIRPDSEKKVKPGSTETVEVRTASNIEDEIARLRVVTRAYVLREYISSQEIAPIRDWITDPEILSERESFRLWSAEHMDEVERRKFNEEGAILHTDLNPLEDVIPLSIYWDSYQWQRVPFAVFNDKGNCFASARLIIPTESSDIPTFKSPVKEHLFKEGEWFDRIRSLEPGQYAEISQLAHDKDVSNDARYLPALLRKMYQYSMENGIKYWFATIDNYVLKLMNGILHMNAVSIGTPIENYIGSTCTPVVFDLDNSVRMLQNDTNPKHRALGNFIAGVPNVEGMDGIIVNP